MYLLEWVFREVRKEKSKTILMISASFLLILFLGFFKKSIINNEHDLEEIYNTLEVKMVIHRTDGESILMLSPEKLVEIDQSGYFDENIYAAAFEYGSAKILGLDTNDEDKNGIWVMPDANEDGDYVTKSLFVGDSSFDLSYGESVAGISSPLSLDANVNDKKSIKIHNKPTYSAQEVDNIQIDLNVMMLPPSRHDFCLT